MEHQQRQISGQFQSATLDQLRIELGKRNSPIESGRGLEKIIFDLPSSISTTFADSLRTILVRETTENWNEMYGHLVSYVDDKGNARPSYSTTHRGAQIGRWVSKQRRIKEIIDSSKSDLLESLPGWSWDALSDKWSAFSLYRNRINSSGSILPEKINGIRIAAWVSEQRKLKANDTLESERLTYLNLSMDEPGMHWTKWEKDSTTSPLHS